MSEHLKLSSERVNQRSGVWDSGESTRSKWQKLNKMYMKLRLVYIYRGRGSFYTKSNTYYRFSQIFGREG